MFKSKEKKGQVNFKAEKESVDRIRLMAPDTAGIVRKRIAENLRRGP